MPQQQEQILTFEGGQRRDITPDRQQPSTYRRAVGFGLRFQPAAGGQALNLSALYGSQKVQALPAGYVDIGSVALYYQNQLLLLLCLTNGTSSRMALFSLPDQLTPSVSDMLPGGAMLLTIFNDDNDPNGQRLAWLVSDRLRLELSAETGDRVRVIINSGRQEPLAIPLHLGFQNLDPLTTYPALQYPKYWSVHAFTLQPGMQPGRLQLVSTKTQATNSLPTGAYRAAYRYVGTPIGQPEEYTSVVFPPDPAYVLPQTKKIPTSSHDTFLREVGNPSGRSLQFVLNGVDKRWSRVELLVSYSANQQDYGAWVIADSKDINLQNQVFLSHTSPSGTGRYVADSEIVASWQVVRSAQDAIIEKSALWLGGVKVARQGQTAAQTIDTSAVTLLPRYKLMEMDNVGASTFQSENQVLTDTYRLSRVEAQQAYIKANGSPEVTNYVIDEDFPNYKGVQYAARFGAHWHGERYPYAAMLVDDKGQPQFAIPLGDFVTPEQYEGDNLLTQQVGGLYKIKVLGLVIDHIRIPKSVVFDEDGVQRVTGIMIVRGPASGSILYQGVVQNLVYQTDDAEDGGSDKLSVLPTWSNLGTDAPRDGNVLVRAGTIGENGSDNFVDLYQKQPDDVHAGAAALKPGYVSFIAPDLLVNDGNLVVDKNRDELVTIATAHPVYKAGNAGTVPNGVTAGVIELAGNNGHVYTKNYQFDNSVLRPNAQTRSWPGTHSRVVLSVPVNSWGGVVEKFDPEQSKYSIQFDSRANVGSVTNGALYAFRESLALKNTQILKVPDIGYVDAGKSTNDCAGVMIANYKRVVDPIPGEQIKYQSTGQFIPLTPADLANLPVVGDSYEINGVEVYGNEIYPWPVDILRLYPQYEGDAKRPYSSLGNLPGPTVYSDYAVGMIVPLESRVNFALRAEYHYANAASYPRALKEGDNNSQFAHGRNQFQPEYWNAARASRVGLETIRTFGVQPAGQRIDAVLPYSLLYSQVSTHGEAIHHLRRLPPVNVADLDGRYGPFVQFVRQFTFVYIGQPDAIGRLQLSERSQIVDESGKQLTLGTGGQYGGVDYVVKGTGWQKYLDAFESPKAIYWVDRRRGKWGRLSQAGVDMLSDRDAAHDLFTDELPKLLPTDTVAGAYDPINERIWLSISGHNALVYNEEMNAFEGEWYESARIYHALAGQLLIRSGDNLYRMSTGLPSRVFGVPAPLQVQVVVSPMPQREKVWTMLGVVIPEAIFPSLTKIVFSAQIARPGVVPLHPTQTVFPQSDERCYYDSGILYLPIRELETGQQEIELLAGHTLVAELFFDPLRTDQVIYLQSLSVRFYLTNLR